MLETDEELESAGRRISWLGIATLVVVAVVLTALVAPHLSKRPKTVDAVVCRNNLHQLGLCMKMYSDKNDGEYPTADKWNDLVKEHIGASLDDDIFVCPEKTGTSEACSYAMNPNANPYYNLNTAHWTVLLFECSGGWNRYGDAELMHFDNHKNKSCNVLLSDYSIRSIKFEEVGQLRWK